MVRKKTSTDPKKPVTKDAASPNARMGNLRIADINVQTDFNARFAVELEDGSKTFDTSKGQTIAALANSIKAQGLMNPLGIQEYVDEETGVVEYYLISGFRRHEACIKAGVTTAPCRIVRGMSEQDALAENLAENMARDDLRPAEAAEGCARLSDAGMSGTEIAKRVGRSKSHVNNLIRVKRNLNPKLWDILVRDTGETTFLFLMNKCALDGMSHDEQWEIWEAEMGAGKGAAPDPDKDKGKGKDKDKNGQPNRASAKVLAMLEQAIRETGARGAKVTRSAEWRKGALAIVLFAQGKSDKVVGLPKGWDEPPKKESAKGKGKGKGKGEEASANG